MKGEGEGVSRYVPHIGCVMTEYKGGREGVSRYVRHIGCVVTEYKGGRGRGIQVCATYWLCHDKGGGKGGSGEGG